MPLWLSYTPAPSSSYFWRAQKRTLSFIRRAFQWLQSKGIFPDKGEQSIGRRLMRAASLWKNRHAASKILNNWKIAALRVLLRRDIHTLYLPHPVKMHILPYNLTALVRIFDKIPIKQILPSEHTLVWEIAPGRYVKTLTNQGLELMIMEEIFIQQQYGTQYEGLRVLDVGGYIGLSSVFFALKGAEAVPCIEPYPPLRKGSWRTSAWRDLKVKSGYSELD